MDLIEHVPVKVTDDPVKVVALCREMLKEKLIAGSNSINDRNERDAFNKIKGENATSRELTPNLRHILQRIALWVGSQTYPLPCFDEVVKFVRSPSRKLVDYLLAASRSKKPDPVQKSRHGIHDLNVGGENLTG